MKRIVVLVSGGGTNLQALLDAQDRGEISDGQITCVIASKPGVYALERAAAHGIPGKVLERKAYPDVHAYSAAMRDLLLAEQADLVLPLLVRENDYIFKPSTSRYAMLAMVDVLATELAMANKTQAKGKLRRIKLALDSHRGGVDRQPLGD